MVQVGINGNEGFIIDMGENYHLTWDNGDYIFEIVGNVSENVLMDMVNSVQKVE